MTVFQSISGRLPEREKERRNDRREKKNVQTTPSRTYCKRSKPLPYSNLNKQDAPVLEAYPASSHHPTTPFIVWMSRCNAHIENDRAYN